MVVPLYPQREVSFDEALFFEIAQGGAFARFDELMRGAIRPS
jgi:hypothetical protein